MEIYSSEDVMKKSLRSDIELNKKTYMICLASDIAYQELQEILNAKDLSIYDKTQELRDYFNKTGIKEKTIEEIKKSFNNAEKTLNQINLKKNHLSKLNRYLINRKY